MTYESLLDALKGHDIQTEDGQRAAVDAISGVQSNDDYVIDNQFLYNVGTKLKEICTADLKTDDACALLVGILRSLDSTTTRSSDIPLSTIILDAEHGFVPCFRQLLYFLCLDVQNWMDSCNYYEYELALRKAMEFVFTTCTLEEEPDNILHTKMIFGDMCIKVLVTFGLASQRGMGRARRDALSTLLQLIHGCETNLKIMIGALQSISSQFTDFLSECSDHQTQIYYTNIMYRLHKYSRKNAKECTKCKAFLEQDFGEFEKKFFTKKFDSAQSMEKASLAILAAFNQKSNKWIKCNKVRCIVMSSSEEGCNEYLHSKKSSKAIAQNQALLYFGQEFLTFQIDTEDGKETLDVPLRSKTKLDNAKAQLYVMTSLNPRQINPSLEFEDGMVICIVGGKSAVQKMHQVFTSAHTEEAPQKQKISRGISFNISHPPSKRESGEKNTKAQEKPPGQCKHASFLDRRLGIWWNKDKRFYYGKVTGYTEEKLRIHYDDGDVEWITPSKEKIDFNENAKKVHPPIKEEQAPVKAPKNPSTGFSRKATQAQKKKAPCKENPEPKPGPVTHTKPKSVKRDPPKNQKKTPLTVSRIRVMEDEQEEYQDMGQSDVTADEEDSVQEEEKHIMDSEISEEESTEKSEDEMWLPEQRQANVRKRPAKKPAQGRKTISYTKIATPQARKRSPVKPKTASKSRKDSTSARRKRKAYSEPSTESEIGESGSEEMFLSKESSPDLELQDIPIIQEPVKPKRRKLASKASARMDSIDDYDSLEEEQENPLLFGDGNEFQKGTQPFDTEPSLFTTSTGEETEINALHQMIQQILTSRRDKKARRKKKVVESFKMQLEEDSKRLKSFVASAVQDSMDFCSDVHTDIAKEFETINAKMQKSIEKFSNEIQALSKHYSKFVHNIEKKQKDVDCYTEKKLKHSRDCVMKVKSKAEALMLTTKQKIEKLNKKKDSIPQISSLLNTLMMEE